MFHVPVFYHVRQSINHSTHYCPAWEEVALGLGLNKANSV